MLAYRLSGKQAVKYIEIRIRCCLPVVWNGKRSNKTLLYLPKEKSFLILLLKTLEKLSYELRRKYEKIINYVVLFSGFNHGPFYWRKKNR